MVRISKLCTRTKDGLISSVNEHGKQVPYLENNRVKKIKLLVKTTAKNEYTWKDRWL